MKTIYKISKFFTVFIALVFIGCQRDDVDSQQKLSTDRVVIKATTSPQTRVSLYDTSDYISVEWSEGDSFSLYDESGVYVGKFDFLGGDDLFQAEDGIDIEYGHPYTAIYPYIEGDEELTLSERILMDVNAPNVTQTQNSSVGHINDVIRMYADVDADPSADGSIYVTFSHRYAILKMTYSLDSGIYPKTLVLDGCSADDGCTLSFTEEEPYDIYTSYMPITPFSVDGDNPTFTFTITTSDGNEAIYSTVINSNNIQAGVCYVAYIPEFTVDEKFDIPDGYIAIYSAEQLAKIGNDSDYPLDGDYILMNNISLAEYENWTPIGTFTGYSDTDISSSFTGVFDGGDCVISGLTINSTNSYQGLFGYAYNATIKNITIESPYITCGGSYVGALVGHAGYYTNIENCAVKEGYVQGYGRYVGGVTGYADTITSSYNTSYVCGMMDYYVGGVAGYCDGSGIVAYCYNTGYVNGESLYTGGVVGYAGLSSNLISCYNTGNISGGGYVGGIVGFASSSSIISCFNTGSVYTSYGVECVGILVGYSNVSSSYTLASCFYIDQDDDGTTLVIGGGPNTSTATAVNIEELNSNVDAMNSTASSRGYSDVKYTEGDPADTYLPSLMGETIKYTGTGAVVSTSWMLEDFSSENYPSSDTWVIENSEAEYEDYAGLTDALAKQNNNVVNIVFPNMQSVLYYVYEGTGLFYNVGKSHTVSFPVATTVGSFAFYSNSYLTEASFPNASVIGENAFSYCKSLTSLTLATETGVTLSSVNRYAFDNSTTGYITLTVGSSNTVATNEIYVDNDCDLIIDTDGNKYTFKNIIIVDNEE